MEKAEEEADIECMMDLSSLSSQTECKEETMSYSSILHQMQEQQKRKPGRRCKKKTLMRMAKLLAIAHGWDCETTAMPKARYYEVCATQKGSNFESVPSNNSQRVLITQTHPVQDEGDDGCKEKLHSTNSVDVVCASQTATQTTELDKTFKSKRILSVNKKIMKEESKLNRATTVNSTTTPQLQEDPVLEQDALVLPRPVSASKIPKKSTKGASIVSKEEIKKHLDINDNPMPVPTQDVPETTSEKKRTNQESRQGNNDMKEKSFAKIAEDCNGTASSKAETVCSLGQDFTQKAQEDTRDCNKGGANTIETACTTGTETSRTRDTSGYMGIKELLKPKRKAGRPFKKKTLMRIARLLAIAQEVESNNDLNTKLSNVNEGDVLSSQQQVLPCLPLTSCKLGKRKKDSKITESNVLTHPVRRSTRTQGQTLNYKAMVENMDRKQKHMKADKSVHAATSIKEVANPEGTSTLSLITYHVKLMGKKQRFAKGGKVRKATSMEDATWMADNLMKHENELTISLTKSPGDNIKEKRKNKCKTIKKTQTDSVEVIKEVAHKRPNPAENLPIDGMVKGKRKRKRLKPKMLVAKLDSKITDVISEPNVNITLLKSRSQNRLDKKIKNKNITMDERLTTNEKMSTNKNSLSMSLNDNLQRNQKRKNCGKRTLKEKSTCLEIESNVAYTKHDPIASFISDLSSASLEKKNINMKVTSKNKGKCKAVKEKEILTTSDVENNIYLKAKIDTDVILKEKLHNKSKVTCQRGKTKASCSATNTKKPHRASKVAKDSALGNNSNLACSSSVQGNPSCPTDLNVVKQKQGKSATLEQYFVKASETSLETSASSPYDPSVEIKQVDSITSAVTIRKAHTVRKKRRRNKTGWDTIKKSKRPRDNEPCSKVSRSSTHNSEHAFNSRLCNSQLDEELTNIKPKDEVSILKGSQSSEALCIQSNVNALQGNNPIHGDHAKKAVNTMASPSVINSGSDLVSLSVINSGHDLMDPQPPRCAFRSLTHCQRFKQRNKLWLHQSPHQQKGNSFSCTQCNLQFNFLGSYMDHMQEHAAKTPYACPICPNSFDTAKNLNTHFSNYHKPRNCLKCSTCGKNFSNKITLKKHKMLHKRITGSSHLYPHPAFPVKAP